MRERGHRNAAPGSSARKIGAAALFVAGFLALNCATNQALAVRFADLRANLVRRQFVELEGPLDLLALGDSHGEDAVDPTILGNAFNYCFRGENYILSYYKLRRIVADDRVRIRSLILPYDFHSFSSFWRHQIRPLSFWHDYVDYFELGWYLGELSFPTVKLIEGTLFPYAQDIDETTDTLFVPAGAPAPRRGFVPRADRLTLRSGWEREARGRVDFYLEGENEFDPALAAYLRKLLELCRRQGIRVYLVQYPVTESFYREALAALPTSWHERRARLVAQFPEVTVLDFSTALGDRPDLFANHDHLNRDGAALFSAMLRDALAESAR